MANRVMKIDVTKVEGEVVPIESGQWDCTGFSGAIVTSYVRSVV